MTHNQEQTKTQRFSLKSERFEPHIGYRSFLRPACEKLALVYEGVVNGEMALKGLVCKLTHPRARPEAAD